MKLFKPACIIGIFIIMTESLFGLSFEELVENLGLAECYCSVAP